MSESGASCVDALAQAFFLLSFTTNLLSTGKSDTCMDCSLLTTTFAGLIMRRILWSDIDVQGYHHNAEPVRSVKWRVFESILQSAAIYSVASLSLAVTAFVSPTIAFPALHSVFPSIIVSSILRPARREVLTGSRLTSFPAWYTFRASSSC